MSGIEHNGHETLLSLTNEIKYTDYTSARLGISTPCKQYC